VRSKGKLKKKASHRGTSREKKGGLTKRGGDAEPNLGGGSDIRGHKAKRVNWSPRKITNLGEGGRQQSLGAEKRKERISQM